MNDSAPDAQGAAHTRRCLACGDVAEWRAPDSAPLNCPACGTAYLEAAEARARALVAERSRGQTQEVPVPPSPTAAAPAPDRTRRLPLMVLGAAALLAVVLAVVLWPRGPRTAEAALALCRETILAQAAVPEATVVPNVRNINDGEDFVFAWNANSALVQMATTTGTPVPTMVFCAVSPREGRIIDLAIDNRQVIGSTLRTGATP